MKRIVFFLPLLLLFSSCDKLTDVSNEATTIEEFYEKDGDSQVSTIVIKNSSGANEYKIFYPSNLADNTPLITWGNGSNVGPDEQEPILNHMATWGYIVVANYNPGNLGGIEIMGAVRYMLQQDSNPNSRFTGRLMRPVLVQLEDLRVERV
jgi:hypothetical protein